MLRNDLLVTIYKTKFWKDLKPDFMEEAKKINTLKKQADFLAKWSYYFLYQSPTTTLKGRSLEMRKALTEAGVKETNPIFNFFKVPSGVYTEMNNKYTKEISKTLLKKDSDDSDNSDDSDENKKIDYVKLTETVLENLIKNIEEKNISLMSNNSREEREFAYQKIMVLAIATGRRQIEILKTMVISKKRDEVLYKNLVKKAKADRTEIVAPILIDLKLAKKYIKEIREEFQTDKLTNKEVNSQFNGSIKKALFRYLPKKIAEQGFHFFRSMYAETCYQKFAKNGVDKNMYFTEKLGHEVKTNAAHSYQAKIEKANKAFNENDKTE